MVKEIVIPGDIIGVIEEYTPNKNCYENENGDIVSTVYGEKVIDKEKLQVSVYPHRRIYTLRRGSIVLGYVTEIRRQNANIEIAHIKIGNSFKELKTTYKASLSITNLSQRYVKHMYDGLRPGDWIIAKIIKIDFSGNINLSLYGSRDLGVIFASCFICGHEVTKVIKRDLLRCNNCGATQSRILSSDFPLNKSKRFKRNYRNKR